MIAPSQAVELLDDLEVDDADVCLAIIQQRIQDLEALRRLIVQRSPAPSR